MKKEQKIKKSPSLYLKLFLSTLQLSAFTFGGGSVIISLLQKKFVEQFEWITKEEMWDIVAIAQSSPGAIAVNASLLIGHKMGGIKGALCTLLGTILPPLVIITLVSFFYTTFRSNEIFSAILRGMQAGVAAVVVDVIYRMGKSYFMGKDFLSIVLIGVTFFLSYFLEVNVIFIILGAIIFGIFLFYINKYIDKNKENKEKSDNKKHLKETNKSEERDSLNSNLDNINIDESVSLSNNKSEVKKGQGGETDDLS